MLPHLEIPLPAHDHHLHQNRIQLVESGVPYLEHVNRGHDKA